MKIILIALALCFLIAPHAHAWGEHRCWWGGDGWHCAPGWTWQERREWREEEWRERHRHHDREWDYRR